MLERREIRQTRKAAEQGDADAQFNLGFYYEKGDGVPQDYQEAAKWYRRAAEQGHASAQLNLGRCYRFGHGVSRDFQEAMKWYRKAAEQGHAEAQFNLGFCYYYGDCVSQDLQEAVKWYRKAAKQGYAGAQWVLGDLYENGFCVSRDFQEAVKWFRKAADQGLAGAQCNLGACYEEGRGVSQDFQEALKWYRKAADQGHAKGKESLNRLEQKMAEKGQLQAPDSRTGKTPDSRTGKAPVRYVAGAEDQAVTKPDSDGPDYPEPYSGSQPYIFISCAHGDKATALPLIQRMKDAGLRLWYDKGTDPGPESDDVIADRLLHCDGFVALISGNYLNSDNCKDELNYAREKSKERLLVYIEDVTLPPALEMRLGRLQAIFYHKYESMDAFMKEALRASLFVRNLTGK